MAYVTKKQLKAYLDITSASDDSLLKDLIDRAQSIIEGYTHRVFEVSSATARYLDAIEDVEGVYLYLNDDLCTIDEVKTDADGDNDTLTEDTHFITDPRYETPYHRLKMLSNHSYTWTYTTDPEMGIKVTGKWGYSASPSNQMVQITLRMASYFYRQKDAQVFDTVAMPEAGVIMLPQGIPADVKVYLDGLIRR